MMGVCWGEAKIPLHKECAPLPQTRLFSAGALGQWAVAPLPASRLTSPHLVQCFSKGSLLQAEPRAVLEAGAGDVLGERHPPAMHTAPDHPVILQTQPGAAPGFATGQGKDQEEQEHHPSVPHEVPAITLSPQGSAGILPCSSTIASPHALVTGL